MKRLILFSLMLSVVLVQAQDHVPAPKHLLNRSIKIDGARMHHDILQNENIPYKNSSAVAEAEEEIGDTRYDNQSNASIPKKIVLFDDGTIGATWTRSMEEGTFFADRGTGYNYFNLQEWGEWPTARVEDVKVHRPVYAAWGENGEMIISHTSGAGLYMATRADKGMGDWDFQTITGPPGEDYILWARAVTGGSDNTRIHLLSLTLPESHGGVPYEGLDGALLYSLSLDGGQSWEIEHEILDGMTSDEYNGFPGDTYAFAEPVGDVVAFVVGDPWTGLFLMKSTDGGFNFEKTIIWEHPYPDWEFGTATDTFYCADGSQSLAIDSEGIVHVAFGVTRVEADVASTYWYQWVDGIAYWNEDMPAFSDNLNALCPYDHPDSELIEDYNLIAWSQDTDGNGQLDFLDDCGLYFIGLSSMPQLVIDPFDHMFLVYSSVTEGWSNGMKNYRHIWARAHIIGQPSWAWGEFKDLTDDLIHIFDECVYPAVASNSDDYIHLIYQADTEPGTAVWMAQHDYVDNRTIYTKEPKADPWGIDDILPEGKYISVSDNFPNPFSTTSWIEVEVPGQCDLRIIISNPVGQVISETLLKNLKPGTHKIELSLPSTAVGVYFYTVSDGKTAVTKKMIVD